MGARRDPEGARNVAYIEVARQLRANGYSAVPLAGKVPSIKAWPAIFCDRLPTLDEIEREWSAGRLGPHVMNGVGVAAAEGLMIIDIDDDAAVERVLTIVPQACAAPACIGRRGRKIFMRAADGRSTRERNITGASTAGVLEVLAWHRQGVIPPTVHPKSGRPYAWVDERRTLLTVPLEDLPTLADADVDALRAAFVAANSPTVGRQIVEPPPRRAGPADAEPSHGDGPSDRWWETSPNRAKIEQLVQLFGVVHRAARDQGGRIVIQAEGADTAGKPHRPEIVDIDQTAHWRNVVRIIVDALGNTEEAYRLHVAVSRGNAMLGLPGGPATYDEVGNKRFFDRVAGAEAFAAKSGRRPRTMRSLVWWARMIQGRPPRPQHARRKGLLAPFHASVARLQRAGVEPNVAAARRRAVLMMRAGGKRLAIVNEALEFIAQGGGTTTITDIAEVAAAHGVSVRTVQSALTTAERAGVLLRTRGTEGSKQILLTVPTVVEPETGGSILNRKGSPSLPRCVCEVGSVMEEAEQGNASRASLATRDAHNDAWLDGPEAVDAEPLAPFGTVRWPVSDGDQQAFDELLEEASRGRCTEETLLLAGILPPEVSRILLQIVEQNRAGKKTGSKWLRHIASEIGELILRESERWPWLLQDALGYVADRMDRTRGRPTPIKWARVFAENIGFVHERAGRLTPMARAAQAARRRRERAQSADAYTGGSKAADKKTSGNT